MVKTRSQIVDGVQIVEKTEESPKDLKDRWNWEMDKLLKRCQGLECSEPTAIILKHTIFSIVQNFSARGDFPPDLFELDHEFRVHPNGIQMDIVVPRWLHRWMDTGEFMTRYEVIQYLESPLQDLSLF